MIEKILKNYKTQKEGLSYSEAEKRLKKYGPNKLIEQKGEGPVRLFLSQFADILIFLLIFAAILSYIVGNHLDAIVILVVVIINSIIGFIQEYRAENAMEELKNLVSTETYVKRDGKTKRIPGEDLTIGDIVILEEGNKVPADILLIESYDLEIDESSLTGESKHVIKNTDYNNIKKINEKIEDLTIKNYSKSINKIQEYSKEKDFRKILLSMNSNVLSGRGIGVVVAVGMNTSMGQIASMIQEKEEETPLSIKVDKIGKIIGILAILICIGVFFIDFFQNLDILEGFMTAVSLAVAAIPEGLPAVLTLTLALGMQKMTKSNAIVKKLSSVETLGSCTVICTDKTGTLTENKMTVREDYLLNKTKSVFISSLCNNAKYDGEKLIGNPTDIAVYNFAKKEGFDELNHNSKYTRIDEIPLDSNRKRMSVIYKKEDKDNKKPPKYYILTKGAPELLLNLSNYIENENKINTTKKIKINTEKYKNTENKTELEQKSNIISLDEKEKDKINKKINEMTHKSLRVIGLSYKEINEETLEKIKSLKNNKKDRKIKEEILENNLIFTGLLGIMDPPREEAISAVKNCQKAGIKVVMITGDHKDTATAIAKEIGILSPELSEEEKRTEILSTSQPNGREKEKLETYPLNKQIITGEELDKLSDEEYSKIADDIKVYARVFPEQKRRIIEVLQNKGNIVSMTGDGVNDAPALKKASIGVAMGSGTEVTKESADMIIQDNNFATIVSSIKEGRTIYDNLKRFLKFQLSTNIGAILTITIGSILPIPTPFTPIQLLWINIIMDGPPAQSLGLEGSEEDVLNRPPERGELLNKNTMIKITISGIVMTIGTLALFCYELQQPTASTTKAITMAFTVFVLYQLFNALNYRSNSKETNKTLWFSLIGTFILQLFVIYVPYLQIIFRTCAINLFDWIIIFILSALILVSDKLAERFIK